MSEADWRTVGYIGVALGVFLLIGGFITYFFPQYYSFLGYSFAVYPYRGYSVGLFVAGLALVVAGGGSWWRADTEKQKNLQRATRPSPSTQTTQNSCIHCGAMLQENDVFCRRCGVPHPVHVQSTMICSRCKNHIPSDSRFCPKCGADLFPELTKT